MMAPKRKADPRSRVRKEKKKKLAFTQLVSEEQLKKSSILNQANVERALNDEELINPVEEKVTAQGKEVTPELQSRLNKLKKMNPGTVFEGFHDFVFEDYLDMSKTKGKVKTTLPMITRRWKAAVRVQKYLDKKYWKLSMVRHFVCMNGVPEPQWDPMLISGFLLREIGIALSASDLFLSLVEVDKCCESLATFLGKNCVQEVVAAYPDAEFSKRLEDATSGEWAKKVLETEVTEALKGDKTWLEKRKDTVIEEIFSDAFDTYPDHPQLGRSTVVKRIVKYLQSTPQSRRQELKEALNKYGLELRTDSHLCQGYINASVGNSLEHVVAIMRLTSKLFEYSYRHYSENSDRWNEMLDDYIMEGDTIEDACERVLDEEPDDPEDYGRSRRYDRYQDDYSDDDPYAPNDDYDEGDTGTWLTRDGHYLPPWEL